MPRRRPDFRWLRIALGYGLLAAIALVVTPAFVVSFEPSHRLFALRTAAAVLTGVILLHVASHRRAESPSNTPSDFEIALRRRPLAMELDPIFAFWRDYVRMCAKNRAYFNRSGKSRLSALAAQFDPSIEASVKELSVGRRPAERLEELDRLIRAMEEQR